MNYVEPIPVDKLRKIQEKLLDRKQYRDWLLVSLGIHLALRISDLLSIKLCDVFNPDMSPKRRLIIREKKTHKENRMLLAQSVIDILDQYAFLSNRKYNDYSYLFYSRRNPRASLDRTQSWRILNKIAKEVGVKTRIGNHSLRKSYGARAFELGISLDDLAIKLNHSSIQQTKRYIGLNDKMKHKIDSKVYF